MINSIGLNIMCTTGEHEILKRCLDSVIKLNFVDNIYILLTSKDKRIKEVAESYTPNVFYKKWNDDFSASRNYLLSKTPDEYVMWLDADDIIEHDENTAKIWQKVKEWIFKNKALGYLVDYNIPDDNGNINTCKRCRIFLNNTKWKYRVHEGLLIEIEASGLVGINGISVKHMPIKSLSVSIERNLRILQRQFELTPNDQLTKFYYARSLYNISDFEKAIPLFLELINDRKCPLHNLYFASYLVAKYYLNTDGVLSNEEKISLSENFARVAMSFTDSYAEAYTLLGMIYENKNLDAAISFYEEAMKKDEHAPGFKFIIMYKEIPSDRIARIYFSRQEYEKALLNNRISIDNCKDTKKISEYLSFRDEILEYLMLHKFN